MKPIHVIFIFFLYGVNTSQAQWVCNDIIPDISKNGYDSIDVDMDNDLVPDFRIFVNTGFPIPSMEIVSNHIGVSNAVLTDATGFAQALDLNTPIGATSTTWTTMNSLNVPMSYNAFPA